MGYTNIGKRQPHTATNPPWSTSRGESQGVGLYSAQVHSHQEQTLPVNVSYQAGEFVRDTVIFKEISYGSVALIYDFRLSDIPNNEAFAEALFFFQWGHNLTYSKTPHQDDLPFTAKQQSTVVWEISPVRALKVVGEATVMTFTNHPPQYSMMVAQKLLVQAIKALPEFKVTITFTYPNALRQWEDLAVVVNTKGMIGAHVGVSALQWYPVGVLENEDLTEHTFELL